MNVVPAQRVKKKQALRNRARRRRQLNLLF
jgi:hypothetical protein